MHLMGYDLYRMLRAGMPAEWSQGERLVALIIADACNDRTGLGYISNQQLCTETGYAPEGLSKVFRRLSQRGYEMRIPHGTGKDGRPVYAARGHGTDYCVPILKPRPTHGLCDPEEGRAETRALEKGRAVGGKGRALARESPCADTAPTPVPPTTPNN